MVLTLRYRIMYELAVCSDGMTEAKPRLFRQNRPASEYVLSLEQPRGEIRWSIMLSVLFTRTVPFANLPKNNEHKQAVHIMILLSG